VLTRLRCSHDSFSYLSALIGYWRAARRAVIVPARRAVPHHQEYDCELGDGSEHEDF